MGSHPHRESLSGFDALGEREREDVLRHVASCAACRAIWSEADPSRLFALLGADPVPGEALGRLTARIRQGLDEIAAERTTSPRRGLGWASVAASLLLAAAIGGYVVSRPGTRIATVEPAATAPHEAEFAGGGIEVMTPTDAEVYDLTVGDTQIVMIFDERLDI